MECLLGKTEVAQHGCLKVCRRWRE